MGRATILTKESAENGANIVENCIILELNSAPLGARIYISS